MTALKTAIIGYGRSGSSLHADPIDKLPDFQLTAVCDIDPAAREKACQRFHCKAYDDYKTMLANEELDLVVIVTRSDQHARMACDCLRAGKNVLVTKPWALHAGQAEEMIAAAKKWVDRINKQSRDHEIFIRNRMSYSERLFNKVVGKKSDKKQ